MKIIFSVIAMVALSLTAGAQRTCADKAELDSEPGKYLTSAQYPWPAVRAAYYSKLNTAAEKATGKQTLEQIEKLEQKTRSNFTLTGGSLENTFSSEGYQFIGDSRLADYRLQQGFFEWICVNKKMQRNGEYSTVLRIYVNSLPINNLTYTNSLRIAFSDVFENALSLKDPKKYKPGTASPLIPFLTYFSTKAPGFAEAVNSNGKMYYQDVPEEKIRQGSRDLITRYWVIGQQDTPVLVEVSRKEYLESLLEYFEREKQYFPAKLAAAKKEGNSEYERKLKQYANWESIIENKKALVAKVLRENTTEWLSQQAVVNPDQDSYLNQKESLPVETSRHTFRNFYDSDTKAVKLYKYNPAYFTATVPNAATPKLVTIAYRYIPQPSSLRLINNFTTHFDKTGWQSLVK